MSIIVSPSILSADFANLGQDINTAEKYGADWIHVDVMDGHFVPNITIGVPVVKSIRPITNLPLDVHLMIDNPEKYVKPFADAGADILTFHYEAIESYSANLEEDIHDLISKIKSFGMKAGISIKPKTQPEVLVPFLQEVDLVLVMTVEPGFSGQKFMQDCAEKIKFIKQNAAQNLIIEVDGGINDNTGKICTDFGANALVAGNYIFKSDNIEQAIKSLHF